jgi:hypothetical protein
LTPNKIKIHVPVKNISVRISTVIMAKKYNYYKAGNKCNIQNIIIFFGWSRCLCDILKPYNDHALYSALFTGLKMIVFFLANYVLYNINQQNTPFIN